MAQEKYEPVERYIEKRFWGAHMSKVQLPTSQQKSILAWIKKPSNFLVMLGCPGCGKSFTAIAITRHLFDIASKKIQYPSIFYYPQGKIYEEFRELYHNRWSDEPIKKRLSDALLLTIDDFGCTRNNEWQAEIMSQLIDERYSNKKPTILTSNLNLDEIEEKFHRRVRSRLQSRENLIISDWETDLRQEGL